jgi:hypothetical protein
MKRIALAFGLALAASTAVHAQKANRQPLLTPVGKTHLQPIDKPYVVHSDKRQPKTAPAPTRATPQQQQPQGEGRRVVINGPQDEETEIGSVKRRGVLLVPVYPASPKDVIRPQGTYPARPWPWDTKHLPKEVVY